MNIRVRLKTSRRSSPEQRARQPDNKQRTEVTQCNACSTRHVAASDVPEVDVQAVSRDAKLGLQNGANALAQARVVWAKATDTCERRVSSRRLAPAKAQRHVLGH